jgi:hypothetical protein
VTGLTGRERYQAQVVAALRAVDVRPPGTFLWFGRRVAVLTPDSRAQADDALGREVLVDRIQQRLYADFYGAGAPRPRAEDPLTPADDGSEFARALSQANCGRGAWQAGWRVVAVSAPAQWYGSGLRRSCWASPPASTAR